jgi:hypothetical protein
MLLTAHYPRAAHLLAQFGGSFAGDSLPTEWCVAQ